MSVPESSPPAPRRPRRPLGRGPTGAADASPAGEGAGTQPQAPPPAGAGETSTEGTTDGDERDPRVPTSSPERDPAASGAPADGEIEPHAGAESPPAPGADPPGTGAGCPAGEKWGTAPADPPDANGGTDAAPEGRFTVVLDNFEGPFDLLLQLISAHKLDVTEVALSRVTDDFISHLRSRGSEWDLDHATEFLVVAATLLDLKAARLLPSAEVEDEADLALLEARDLLFARLLQYRAYKRVAEFMRLRMEAEECRRPRTVSLEPAHAALLPEVVLRVGPGGLARLAVLAMRPRPRPQVYVEHIHAPLVGVREQAAILVARLREAGTAGFDELVGDAPDTLTVVARFLALLELYRDRMVALDQDEALGPLTVRWTGREREPMVSDEFDRPAAPPPAGTAGTR
ncbi:ScpA family protein [Streptomyces sp. ST2-7A]|uniref:segregation and condensation protein A n=1 Tax=Streptomyces sp. ST2-7A TaxID=2907214 RepID=UPI001F483E05|nr:segregation/condensation protein A [Streptomyces sp. ST2-7A]MCE7080803.1 segregation/condensation protein A [Streptomyces sp. ST2-7A]